MHILLGLWPAPPDQERAWSWLRSNVRRHVWCVRLPEHLCALMQTFYLTAEHCRMLKEEEGIEAWCFEQHAHEAVFIPAGCPHQVLPP